MSIILVFGVKRREIREDLGLLRLRGWIAEICYGWVGRTLVVSGSGLNGLETQHVLQTYVSFIRNMRHESFRNTLQRINNTFQNQNRRGVFTSRPSCVRTAVRRWTSYIMMSVCTAF